MPNLVVVHRLPKTHLLSLELLRTATPLLRSRWHVCFQLYKRNFVSGGQTRAFRVSSRQLQLVAELFEQAVAVRSRLTLKRGTFPGTELLYDRAN